MARVQTAVFGGFASFHLGFRQIIFTYSICGELFKIMSEQYLDYR